MGAGNTDYGITLGARVDTSQAQKDINAFTRNDGNNKTRKVILNADINLENINNKLENAINKGLTKKVSDSMQKISTTIRENLARTLDDGTIVNDLTKVTERFKGDLGQIQERVTVFKDSAMKPLTSSLQTVKAGVEDVSTVTNVAVQEINNVTTKVTTLEKTIRDTDGQEHKIIETTNEWIDSQNRLHKEVSITDENNRKLSASTKTVTNDAKKAAQLYEELSNGLAKAQQAVQTTSKVTLVDKDGVTTIKQMVNGVVTLTTKTREYTTAQGALVKETQTLNNITGETKVHTEVIKNKQEEIQKSKELQEQLRKEREERVKTQQTIDNALVSTTTTHSKGKTIQFGDTSGTEYDALITKIEKVNDANEKVIQTTYEFKNAQGQLVTQIRTTDENGRKLAADTIEISDANKKATNSTNQFNTATKNASNATKTFGHTLGEALDRLVKYTIAMLPIQMVRKGIQEAVVAIKEFDSALIEFRKVSDLAGEGLNNYTQKLAKMGELTGSTMTAMVQASTEFKKSGFSEEDSAKLASIAEMYRNIADEEISAAESASFIIAQMKAFNIEADDAEHIIDSVNEVANNFAVSSADLATNLGNMSAIMAINNVSLEEQIGMLTGVTEITRNASSASRGLVMVSSRLTQVLDDTSSTGKKLTAIYKNLGIELKDENGQLRGHYEILGDLAGQWNNLSENEQKYIALTSAGARQQQNFVSLMENWGQVAKATATAYNSLGSAQKENAKVMDSIEKKVEVLKSQFQQLVIGKGGLQDTAKGFLDIAIALLKFANSDIGKTIIQITAFETSLILAVKGVNTLKKAIIEHAIALEKAQLALEGRTAEEIAATTIEFGFTEAVKRSTRALIENATAFATSPFGIVVILLGAIAAITIANIKATEKYNKRLQDEKEKLDELADSAKDAKSELDKLKSSLQTIQDQIKRNNETKLKINDKDQLDALDKENSALIRQEESLKRQITLQEKKLELAQREADTQARKTLETTTSSQFKQTEMIDSFSGAGTGEFIGVEVTPQKELELAIEKYEELKEKAKELQEQLDATDTNTEEWEDLNSELENTRSEMDKVEERGLEMAETVSDAADNLAPSLEHTTEETEQYRDELNNLVDKLYEVTDAEREVGEEQTKTAEDYEKEREEAEELAQEIEKLASSLGITATELEGLRERFDDLTLENFLSQLQEARQTISDTNTVIDNLQDALENASKAQEEYNEKGYLTLDTFQGLMNISAQYLAALINENGQLEINQTTLGNLVEQLKIAKVEELQEAAAMEIAANHTDDARIASANAEGAVNSIGNTIQTTGNKALTAAGHVATFAQSVASLSGISQKDWTARDRETVNYYKNLANQIATVTVNTTKAGNAATTAGKKGSKAAKSAKSATDDLNKSLEETKKKYETVIKWISKQYDKEIDKIKKSEKEALKAEESKIKAKEKEKDNALDAIEKEIKALEKEKDALKDQKEALDERKQALKDEQDAILDNIEKRIKVLEKERDALIKPVEARIKALEEERDAITEATQAEIDSINELKEKRQTYWDDQIDALKNANKELKNNLELQEKLDALEKAKNTKVKIYKEGQGFVYDVDQNAVNEAQKALDEYLSQKAYEDELARLENLKDAEIKSYNDRLKELNNYKDNTKKTYDKQLNDLKNYKDKTKSNYDEQIENLKEYKESVQEQYEEQIKVLEKDIDALEKHMDELDKHKEAIEEHKDAVEEAYEAEIEDLNNHKEAVQEAYEAEIEEWENYKQQFEDLVNAYEEQQNKLLFQQLTGITDESNNWMTRLDNLAEFVRKYNELQKQLDTGNTDVSNTASMSSGSAPSGGYSGSSSKTVTNYNKPSGSTNYTPSYNKKTGYVPTSVSSKIGGRSGAVKRYANGIDSIRDDEIAIVGENPNREVVIGSKINNGDIMSLGKGTGVVNAESTKTLAGMLNQVGQFGASGFGSGNGVLNNNINNDSLVVNGVTIEGSNISDPETFVNGLLNMKAEAIQRAYRHR